MSLLTSPILSLSLSLSLPRTFALSLSPALRFSFARSQHCTRDSSVSPGEGADSEPGWTSALLLRHVNASPFEQVQFLTRLKTPKIFYFACSGSHWRGHKKSSIFWCFVFHLYVTILMMRYVTKFQPLVTTVVTLYGLMKVNTGITLHF